MGSERIAGGFVGEPILTVVYAALCGSDGGRLRNTGPGLARQRRNSILNGTAENIKRGPGFFGRKRCPENNGGDVYRRFGYVVPDHEGTAYKSRTVIMLLLAGRLTVRLTISVNKWKVVRADDRQ